MSGIFSTSTKQSKGKVRIVFVQKAKGPKQPQSRQHPCVFRLQKIKSSSQIFNSNLIRHRILFPMNRIFFGTLKIFIFQKTFYGFQDHFTTTSKNRHYFTLCVFMFSYRLLLYRGETMPCCQLPSYSSNSFVFIVKKKKKKRRNVSVVLCENV